MKLIQVYKGYRIEKDEKTSIFEVVKDGSRFIVGLDDSKRSGSRSFNDDANNVYTAKKYIDYVTRDD